MTGLLQTANNANFSIAPVAYKPLTTSVSSGLLSLFAIHGSGGLSNLNSAGGSPGSTVAYPTFSPTSAQVIAMASGFVFPSQPTGDHSIAIICKNKIGGTANDMVAGSWNGNATLTGGTGFTLYNYRMGFILTNYPLGSTPPLSGVGQTLSYIDLAPGTEFELFVGTAQSNAAAIIYLPRLASTNSQSTVGRSIVFDNATQFQTEALGSGTHDIALFAHWNRVLSPTEVATFYSEMQAQFAAFGVTI